MRGERTMPSDVTLIGHATVPAQRSGEAAPPARSDEAAAAAADQGRSLASDALKRWLDVILSCVLLVVTTPVMLAACLAIVLESSGSPIYRQWRMGRAGRPFQIIKLRSMVPNAHRMGPELTQDRDPRITKVGSILRRWSLDELPQLVNVLVGQMSLVGPRPELVSIVETYTPQQREVFSVRPGLTGWAQVNGRDDLAIPDKLELDREYIFRRSTRLDLEIMARTAGVMVSGRGTKR
jgi:lipopolysaccharide/colanic/teichoic acid biosynthesis glycosyltransferase